MAESVSVLLVSIAAVLTAIDQISIVLTTKKLWRQQQQLLQQLEMATLSAEERAKIVNELNRVAVGYLGYQKEKTA